MRQELLAQLEKITPEEQHILDGNIDIQQNLYTSRKQFVIDSKKLLQKGHLIEIRPHTRFAHFPRHRHNYVEMVYMCSGSTTHIIDQKEKITLQEGDLLFLNQMVYHEILPAGKNDIAVNFIILPEFFSRPISMIERENVLRDFLISTISGESGLSSYLHIPAKGIVPIENLMESMIWTLIDHRTGMNTINQTSMGLLMMYLSSFVTSINRNDPGRQEQNMIFTTLKYIETNYRDGTLSEISELLGQPRYYVSKLLKKHMQHNFKELLQYRKLQQAAYLLDNTHLPVEVIMENIGYNNSSYFYKKFRERYGLSPKEYRSRVTSRL